MSTAKKTSAAGAGRSRLLIAGVAALSLLGAGVWHALPKNEPAKEPADAVAAPADMPAPDHSPHQATEPDTIGASWQLPKETGPTASNENEIDVDSEIPFNADAIYVALQNVRLDQNGDVILDDRALDALNDAFQRGELEFTRQNLSDLQELINAGLPGKAGEQTARIATDFYHYLEAQEEFIAAYEAQNAEEASVEAAERQYQQLQQLRSRYLGDNVASQLFKAENAHFEYMMEAKRIQKDPSLTEEEKVEKALELNKKLETATVNVSNFAERRERFLSEKQRILDAALSAQEKKAQVESLLLRHFAADELQEIEHLDLGAF